MNSTPPPNRKSPSLLSVGMFIGSCFSQQKHASIYDGIAVDCHAGKLHCRGVHIQVLLLWLWITHRTPFLKYDMIKETMTYRETAKVYMETECGFVKNFSLPCDSTQLKWLNWIVVFPDQKQMFALLQCTSEASGEQISFFALCCMRLSWIMKSVEGKENKPYWESKVASQRMQHDSKV